METQTQAAILQTILSGDPDLREVHLSFHLCWDDCVATVELFWNADEPERRFMAIDFDMRRDWALPA